MEIPDKNQIEEFFEHLSNVHSWYKHIPLDYGMKFYIFLSEDSGKNYPSVHPELKYGNDQTGYRKQFGYLDYCYTDDGIHFHSDCSNISSEEDLDKIDIKKSFTLYPYVHDEIYWNFFNDSLESIANGKKHVHSEKLTEVYHLNLRFEDLESDLSWEEFDLCTEIIDGEIELKSEVKLSDMAREYIGIKMRLYEIHDELMQIEREKIKSALEELMEDYS